MHMIQDKFITAPMQSLALSPLFPHPAHSTQHNHDELYLRPQGRKR